MTLTPHDPVRVMLVDDDDKFRALLGQILREDGFDVAASVDSADSAVAEVGDVDPDVVVIDYTLPGADGLRVADDIVSGRPEQPVIIFSSLFDLTLRRESEGRGFRYVEKVDGVDALEASIRAAAGST